MVKRNRSEVIKLGLKIELELEGWSIEWTCFIICLVAVATLACIMLWLGGVR